MLFTPRNTDSSHASKNNNDSFFKTRVQPKLAVGQPGDKYEVEADKTADKVVQKINTPQPIQASPTPFFAPKPVVQSKKDTIQQKEKGEKEQEVQEKPLSESITPVVQTSLLEEPIQEKCDACEEKETIPVQKKCKDCEEKAAGSTTIQQKCDACEKEEKVQAKQDAGNKSTESDLSSKLTQSKGGGVGMDASTQQQMSSGFGSDFSNVRIHTDSNAVQMNKELGSHAFTNGSDVYFNSGKYDPSSDSGKHLLAHELTHTVQQGAVSGGIQKKEEKTTSSEFSENQSIVVSEKEDNKEKELDQLLPDDAKTPATDNSSNNATKSPDTTSETEKGDQLIDSIVPQNTDEKKQDSTNETKEKNPVSFDNQPKETDKQQSVDGNIPDSKQVDTVAAVSSEFHELPSFQSLLQKPSDKQPENQSNEPAATPIQMKQEKNPDFKPEEIHTPEEFIARITESSQANTASVTTHSETLLGDINRRSEEMKNSIYANIQNSIIDTRLKFTLANDNLTANIDALEATLNANLEQKIADVIAEGETTKVAIQTLFSSHLLNIDTTVNNNIQLSTDMQTHYRNQVNTLIDGQVDLGRSKRDSKNARFPNSEKGQKQREAVTEVANTTIQDMAGRKPSIIEAITDTIQPIPEEFRKKGIEAKSGVTEKQTPLITDVDSQVKQIIAQLKTMHQESLTQLKSFQTDLKRELLDQETYTINQLEGLLPGVDQQIADAVSASVSGLETTKNQLIQQLSIKSEEAIIIINSNSNSDPESMEIFCTTVVNFLNGITTESTGIMTQGVQLMVDKTQTVSDNVTESINATAISTDEMINSFEQNTVTSFTSMETGHTQNMNKVFDSMSNAFKELTGKIRTQFDTSIREMAEGFAKTLSDAEVKIKEAVNSGLAKNDEALGLLDGQMNEAATDAEWRYDNPIKATLLDIGSFVVGLVVGIVLVLALVVVAIVAFKLLLAGLVALGISLVIAKIIVLVVGLALLAYGIYRAYNARTANGESGGLGTFGMALLDVVGITAIYRGLTQKGLTPFQRGFLIGEGIATIASFFLARKIDGAISSRLPASIANPGGVSVAGVGGKSNGGGGKVIELFPNGPRPTGNVGGIGGGTTGGTRASAFNGNAALKLVPQIAPIEQPRPGIVIPFPRQNPAAAVTPTGGTPNPLIGTGAAAGVNPATTPARRNANQTCEDSVLDVLQAEKKVICESIPGGDCGTALKRLRDGKPLSGSVKNLTRSQVLARINRFNECLAKRKEIQDKCFGGLPDAAHQDQIDQLTNGRDKCNDLVNFIDGLSQADKIKLQVQNW